MRLDPLELPDFQGTNCFYFEACGKIRGVGRRQRLSRKVARVRVHKHNAYLRLLQDGSPPPGHLHVDLALARFKSGPEINSTRAEIAHEISRHYGESLDVLVSGQYATMIKDIPSGSGVVFAGASAVVTTVNNIAIEVAGAHLLLRNEGFVRTIDWQIISRDVVFIEVSARCDSVVSPHYLVDIFQRLNKAYSTYIKERAVDGSPQPRV